MLLTCQHIFIRTFIERTLSNCLQISIMTWLYLRDANQVTRAVKVISCEAILETTRTLHRCVVNNFSNSSRSFLLHHTIVQIICKQKNWYDIHELIKRFLPSAKHFSSSALSSSLLPQIFPTPPERRQRFLSNSVANKHERLGHAAVLSFIKNRCRCAFRKADEMHLSSVWNARFYVNVMNSVANILMDEVPVSQHWLN